MGYPKALLITTGVGGIKLFNLQISYGNKTDGETLKHLVILGDGGEA